MNVSQIKLGVEYIIRSNFEGTFKAVVTHISNDGECFVLCTEYEGGTHHTNVGTKFHVSKERVLKRVKGGDPQTKSKFKNWSKDK